MDFRSCLQNAVMRSHDLWHLCCVVWTGAMIRDGYLKSSNIDVVVFPGGSSKKQSRILSGVGQRKLMEFVRDGGGFVGICAGAYLASTRQMGLMNVEAVKCVVVAQLGVRYCSLLDQA